MVLRSFTAFDNEALVIAGGSPFGTPGSPVANNSDTPNGTIFTYQSGFAPTTITLDDTNDVDLFNDDQAANHVITDGAGLVANGQIVESESNIVLRALDGAGVPTGPEITITVYSQGGSFTNIWGYGTTQPLVVGTSYVKVSGTNAGASDYNILIGAPCFAEGTRVRMADGSTQVIEDIVPGDLVWCQDDLACTLRDVVVSLGHGRGDRAPVTIAAGVFDNIAPVTVSPQHRVLVAGPEADILFGTDRLLVPAVHLVGMPGVTREERASISYYHLVFDRHRIVDTAGLLSESFYPGPLTTGHWDQIETGTPSGFAESPPPPLAPTLKSHEGRMLADAMARRSLTSR
ncbi:MAG: Hint domain-containing protein [Pseudomonadota bacterium]